MPSVAALYSDLKGTLSTLTQAAGQWGAGARDEGVDTLCQLLTVDSLCCLTWFFHNGAYIVILLMWLKKKKKKKK
jgi:hypothetical protein